MHLGKCCQYGLFTCVQAKPVQSWSVSLENFAFSCTFCIFLCRYLLMSRLLYILIVVLTKCQHVTNEECFDFLIKCGKSPTVVFPARFFNISSITKILNMSLKPTCHWLYCILAGKEKPSTQTHAHMY